MRSARLEVSCGRHLIQIAVPRAVKVWTKRRKINDPYLGTLSSYGYVLLVIFYLINARRIPVLPSVSSLSAVPFVPTDPPLPRSAATSNNSRCRDR